MGDSHNSASIGSISSFIGLEAFPLSTTENPKKTRNTLIAAAVVAALTAGAVGSQAIALPDDDKPVNAEITAEPMEQNAYSLGPASFSELVKAVKPAVVNISISGRAPGRHSFGPQEFRGFEGSPFDEFFREYFGNRGQFQGQSRRGPAPEFRAVGSDFIISDDGYVVTNNHVIEHAEEIDVVLQDGSRYSAVVQGRDPKTDLALLKVDADEDLPYVELGSSQAAEVGDWVLAVGNPFGLGGTVTAGIISARGRDIQAGPFDDFLQIDAPINRGNSGGPLFDDSGRVIGINTAIYSPSGGSVGIGFAIPAEMAGDIIDQLKVAGVVERGWLGVEFQAVNEAVAASLGMDEAHGALVAGVVDDGPAEKAGMQVGDVILSMDGERLDDPKDLPRMVASTRAGERVNMEVLRNGKTRTLKVKIGQSEAEQQLAAAPAASDEPARLGVRLSELTPEIRERYRIEGEGVLVTDVERDSPAARAGIRPGQVITMVGQKSVDSPNDVADAVEAAAAAGRPSVLLMLEQRGAKRFVAVELAA
jgi:serine protease Do